MDGFSQNALGEFKRKASLVDQRLSKDQKEVPSIMHICMYSIFRYLS